jgi:hypothetical protein
VGTLLSTHTFAIGAPRLYAAGPGLPPDLQTVVPGQLLITTKPTSMLWFTNSIVNLGTGQFQIRGVSDGANTFAYQEILDAAEQLVSSTLVSVYVFHPTHNHWHIDGVARYTLRSGSLTGTIVAEATKVTFCLIDTERALDKSLAAPIHYFGCNSALQGISRGWADQYVRSLPDQNLPIAGLPAGVYYLISTADPDNRFIETNDTNNTAWVWFRLTYLADGSANINELGTSPCTGFMCGDRKVPGQGR